MKEPKKHHRKKDKDAKKMKDNNRSEATTKSRKHQKNKDNPETDTNKKKDNNRSEVATKSRKHNPKNDNNKSKATTKSRKYQKNKNNPEMKNNKKDKPNNKEAKSSPVKPKSKNIHCNVLQKGERYQTIKMSLQTSYNFEDTTLKKQMTNQIDRDVREISRFAKEFSTLIHFDIFEKLANGSKIIYPIKFREYMYQLVDTSNMRLKATFPPINERYTVLRQQLQINESYNFSYNPESFKLFVGKYETNFNTNLTTHA